MNAVISPNTNRFWIKWARWKGKGLLNSVTKNAIPIHGEVGPRH